MRHRAIPLVALLAALGLTACAMKDSAPRKAAEAPAKTSVGGAAQKAAGEEGDFGDETTTVEDRFAEAEPNGAPIEVAAVKLEVNGNGDHAIDPADDAKALPRMVERMPAAPPPPPVAAPAQLNQPIAGMLNPASRTVTVADDQMADGEGLGGLATRGAGRGGGGQGFGRVNGMGRIDAGGGKGYGGGPGAKSSKKKRKASPSKDVMAWHAEKEQMPQRPLSKFDLGEKTRGRRGEVGRDRSQVLDGLDLADEEDKEFDESEEERADVRTEKKQAVLRDARNETSRYAANNRQRHAGPKLGGRAPGGGEFQGMLDPLDGKDIDGRFEVAEYAQRFEPPPRFIPRMCYFENTYLGGNAAYTERLRRLDDALPGGRQPYRAAALPRQPFDAPDDAGLALTATLDRAYVDQPQRVFLQVGLQGSTRYGWRRPPLDIALVVDGAATDGETLVEAVTALSRRLGPQDRLGVVLAGAQPIVLGELSPLRDRLVLARAIEALGPVPKGPPGALAAAMNQAGGMLRTAAGESTRIPGTQTVLVLTRDADASRIAGARGAAHALTVQGAVTSVIQVGGSHQGWWQVANAGHGNYHRTTDDALAGAVDDELGSISRVIARLLRINVKLADGVEAIRIVGSRVLGQQEVKRVKAREEATDRNLSKTMGVKADRGDDDDGVQTVIPYFYGGDNHVILLELWVTRPGPVAEITLKYKDMVALQNATSRVAAQLDRVPRALSPAERRVAANVRGFQLAEGLTAVATHAENGNRQQALDALDALDRLAFGRDQRMLDAFSSMVQDRGADGTVAEALRMARDRRIGHSP